MTRSLIGVDAGTTNIKAVALDLDGDEIARTSRRNAVTGSDGRMEQDMDGTWNRTAETIREVVVALPADTEVIAVGVTGQGDGCWLVDEAGEPARDAILWNDGRAADIVDDWQNSGVADRIFDICRSGTFPGASLPILCWLRDHEPAVLERADTVLFCKDWIKYRLTGELTTDLTDASLPFLDVRAQQYADELTDIVNLPMLPELLPELESATTVIGGVTPAASRKTGLPEETPVISGVIDIVASAFGSGVASPGENSSVVGTTSLNQTLLASVPDDQHRVGFTLAITDDLYTRAMASMAGTPNIDWAREELTESPDFEEVEAAAKSVPVGADGLLYHPYLSTAGERSPFVKPSARAQFTGLEPTHTRANLYRAVYEGVALALRDCYEYLPLKANSVAVSGGGSRSTFWCQLFADCLGADVTVPAGTEPGARGVALLAGVALDEYPDIETAVSEGTEVSRSYTPRPENMRRYEQWYTVYRKTYRAMFDVWDERAAALDDIGHD
jgi:sugar (pentulose or hexulose) kinase